MKTFRLNYQYPEKTTKFYVNTRDAKIVEMDTYKNEEEGYTTPYCFIVRHPMYAPSYEILAFVYGFMVGSGLAYIKCGGTFLKQSK